ncbi:MAG: thioredoxin [Verrucomicrobiota bacterium]
MANKLQNITHAEELETLVRESRTPVVVDFWAPWCGPCQALGPILEEAAQSLAETAQVVKVNVDEHPELARAYGITSIPTLLYFAEGVVQHRESGIPQKEAILAQTTKLLTASV